MIRTRAAAEGGAGGARDVVRLAVPALPVLAAEPLYVLVDTAVVGRLGAVPLAGLAVAGVLFGQVTSQLNFLSYGTTARAARLHGAGRRGGAVVEGVQATWLALLIGLLVLGVGQLVAGPVAGALAGGGPDGAQVAEGATSWLRIALFGTPMVLVTLAGNGWMRGVQDTVRPLRYVLAGNALSALLCPVLVHGVGRWDGWGLEGSAVANVIAQTVSGALFLSALCAERGTGAGGRSRRGAAAGDRRGAAAGDRGDAEEGAGAGGRRGADTGERWDTEGAGAGDRRGAAAGDRWDAEGAGAGDRWGAEGTAAGGAAPPPDLVRLRPVPAVLRAQATMGRDLLLRSIGFQACFLSATAVAARFGAASVAAHQIVLQLWVFQALVLDAVAIAAQSLVGAALGSPSDGAARARALAARVTRYGAVLGVGFAVLFAALYPVLPGVFTADPGVLAAVGVPWWFFAALQPIAGVVFALDGVLLGAGDAAFLRTTTLVAALGGFLPLIWASLGFGWGLAGIWSGLTAFMLVRLAAVGLRARSGAWAVPGAVRT